jgi:hypothetical protein
MRTSSNPGIVDLQGSAEFELLLNCREPDSRVLCHECKLPRYAPCSRAGHVLGLIDEEHESATRAPLQSLGSPKTSSSIGDLPLGPQVVNALSRHRKKQGSDLRPDALVFPNEKGGPHDTHNLLWRVLYPACKTAGVPRVSWHELRHTHATLLNTQGESMKTIQAQLRHSSSRVTMEI